MRSPAGGLVEKVSTGEGCTSPTRRHPVSSPPATGLEAAGRPGTHTCEPSRSTPGFYPRGPGGAGRRCSKRADRAELGGTSRRGAGRAHLRVVEQPQLVEPLGGGHGLTRLRPCCAPPVAASSAPPAGCPQPGPWAEGVTPGRSGAVLLGKSKALVGAALSHPSRHPPPPPAAVHRSASCTSPPPRPPPPPPPRLSRDRAKGGEPSGRRRSRRPWRPHASQAAPPRAPSASEPLGLQTCPGFGFMPETRMERPPFGDRDRDWVFLQ